MSRTGCRGHLPLRRFIYMSTAKVFGSNPTGVIDELSLPRPASHYAITHRLAEDYVLAAHDKQRVEGVVMRLPTCVSPMSRTVHPSNLVSAATIKIGDSTRYGMAGAIRVGAL